MQSLKINLLKNIFQLQSLELCYKITYTVFTVQLYITIYYIFIKKSHKALPSFMFTGDCLEITGL